MLWLFSLCDLNSCLIHLDVYLAWKVSYSAKLNMKWSHMIHSENCKQIFKQLSWKYTSKLTYDPYSKTPGYLLIVHIVAHWYKHDLSVYGSQ